MEAFEPIFNKDDAGNVTAGGYLIDNAMLQQGQPAAVLKGGGSIIDTLKLGELAVPLGLYYLQDLVKKSSDSFNTSVFELYDEESPPVELVEDSLYDKLLAMVKGYEEDESTSKINKKNKITRKKKAISAKKTRGRKN